MTDIGLARGTVRLVHHNEGWSDLFGQESHLLKEMLQLNPDLIQHVGSTAIPGIMAKPIIDIAILVNSLDIAEVWAKPLAGVGYRYKGIQPDMPNRRFFAKGPDENRTIYLHIVNEEEFKRLIKFRNRLRDDASLAKKYSDLKMDLANGNKNDRTAYTKLKNGFIRDVLES